jgi:prepilin-type N-terminal cleavage/methylation domain-containing protein
MKTRSISRIAFGRAGFTLLELLAAIAILAIMITLLFQAFGQASRAWLQAENRVETFSTARGALDLMSRELSQAIATTNIPFLGSANSVAFLAPVSTHPSELVDLEEVVYALNGSSLERRVTPFSAGAAWDFYTQPQTWPGTTSSIATVADNVISLSFSYVNTNGAYETFWNSTQAASTPWSGGNSFTAASWPAGMTNRAPVGVQITLSMIDSKAAARVSSLGGVGNPGFTNAFTNIVNQALKTFSTFVAIPNRQP